MCHYKKIINLPRTDGKPAGQKLEQEGLNGLRSSSIVVICENTPVVSDHLVIVYIDSGIIYVMLKKIWVKLSLLLRRIFSLGKMCQIFDYFLALSQNT